MESPALAGVSERVEYARIEMDDLDHECDEEYVALTCSVDEDDVPVLAGHWHAYRAILEAAPEGATLTVRRHMCTCSGCDAVLTRYGVRVRVVIDEDAGLSASRE